MSFAITGIYASLLALWMAALGMRVSFVRAKTGISILDGSKPELGEAIRRHGNAAETIPMATILMGIAEAQGAGTLLLNAVGLVLLAGRLLHPFGLHHDKPNAPLRAIGMSATLISMLVSIAYILWNAVA